MEILVVDGCVRRECSRTLTLGKYFLESFRAEAQKRKIEYQTEWLELQQMNLEYFNQSRLEQRDKLIQSGKLDHPQFRLAHQFAQADILVVLAPFWDLSLPAVVKVYIEMISVDGITFGMNENGIYGKAKANDLIYVTTRGGVYKDTNLDIGTQYLKALCNMYGIANFHSVAMEGTDIPEFQLGRLLEEGYQKADAVATQILQTFT